MEYINNEKQNHFFVLFEKEYSFLKLKNKKKLKINNATLFEKVST